MNDCQKYLQTKGLDIELCSSKIGALKRYLVSNYEDIVQGAFNYAKDLCDKLSIETEPSQRRRTANRSSTQDGQPHTYEEELRCGIRKSLDRIVREIETRFSQLEEISKKFAFLTPSKLLDPEFECDLTLATDEIDKAEFLVERQRLIHFVAAAGQQSSLESCGPLDLLVFIQKFSLNISVPNIVVVLRLFLTMAISVATCERSFSKLKLMKNHLRSSMSQVRLSNLAILSIEQTITDKLDFEDTIKQFAALKTRRVRF